MSHCYNWMTVANKHHLLDLAYPKVYCATVLDLFIKNTMNYDVILTLLTDNRKVTWCL